VTQLGIRLRVLVDRGESDAQRKLQDLLNARGIDARVQPTDASLEDVFVVATRTLKSGD
jgi:hypothetical protein